jgi:uncharacterized protein (TIGR01777 family)
VRVVVSGSHGLIGSALVDALTAGGHSVTRLVRGAPGEGEAAWDPRAGRVDGAALEGHDAVVHLAGAGIGAHRWTAAYKAEIRDSRVRATQVLVEALAGLDDRPRVLASASAVGVYGDRGDEELTESSPPGTGFLAEVVREWEGAARRATEAGIRVAHLRSGVVLSPRGGALRQQLPLFRLGLGGRLGSGRQYLSWISLPDEVAAILYVLGSDDLEGPVNLTAPAPVTNAEFTRTLGAALGRPALLVVPPAALWVRFGREMTTEMLVAGQRVLPSRLQAGGFAFRHPELAAALPQLL